MTANGNLSALELVAVGGHQLAPKTALQFMRLQAAARQAGHSISVWSPAGGYRSIEVQKDMHLHPERYNIKSGVALAPVGKSTHGQGRAVDIKAATVAGRNWVVQNAAQYGFNRPAAVADPDHYVSGDPLTTETPALQEAPAMTLNIDFAFTPEGAGYAITQDGGAEPLTSTQWAAFQHLRAVQAAPDGADRLNINELVTISEYLRGISAATAARTIRPLLTALKVDVDEAEIAKAIAALTPGQAPIPTAAAIATAVLDEEARRLTN